MKYLAHINEDGEEQTLAEHLKNTEVLSGKFANSFGAYEW